MALGGGAGRLHAAGAPRSISSRSSRGSSSPPMRSRRCCSRPPTPEYGAAFDSVLVAPDHIETIDGTSLCTQAPEFTASFVDHDDERGHELDASAVPVALEAGDDHVGADAAFAQLVYIDAKGAG